MSKVALRVSIIYGVVAALGLLSLYFLVMGLSSGSLDFTLKELNRLKFWVTPLVLGFGTQIGLFAYLKNCHRAGEMAGKTTAAGATTSTVAMLACCAHHLIDVLPLIGLSVAATFLVRYQEWFLGLGIISNLFGVAIMIRQLKKIKS